MSLSTIPCGRHIPDDVNVIIEVPLNSEPVKYEVDKKSGAVFVGRLLATPTCYSRNYGYVTGTLSSNGTPIDALVLTPTPLVRACVINRRPIGMLTMDGEAGPDEKLLVVPDRSVSSLFDEVAETDALPATVRNQISLFFLHYKNLEKNKWMKLIAWRSASQMKSAIVESVKRFHAGICSDRPKSVNAKAPSVAKEHRRTQLTNAAHQRQLANWIETTLRSTVETCRAWWSWQACSASRRARPTVIWDVGVSGTFQPIAHCRKGKAFHAVTIHGYLLRPTNDQRRLRFATGSFGQTSFGGRASANGLQRKSPRLPL